MVLGEDFDRVTSLGIETRSTLRVTVAPEAPPRVASSTTTAAAAAAPATGGGGGAGAAAGSSGSSSSQSVQRDTNGLTLTAWPGAARHDRPQKGSDSSCMLRRIVPADNSCLFHSVGYGTVV